MTKRVILLLLILLILFGSNAIALLSIEDLTLVEVCRIVAITQVIALYCYYIYKKKILKREGWISIMNLFLIGSLIVNFSMPISHLLGYQAEGVYFDFLWASPESAKRGAIYSSLAMISLYLGGILTVVKPLVRAASRERKKKYFLKSDRWKLLLTSTYIFYILFFVTSGSYKRGLYFAGDQLAVSNYFYYLFSLLGENGKIPLIASTWLPLLLLMIFILIGLVRINEK